AEIRGRVAIVAGEGRMREAVAAAHDKMLFLQQTKLRTPGEAETRLEAPVINRRKVPGAAALTGKSKGRNLDCCRYVIRNRSGGRYSQAGRGGAPLRIGERYSLRQVGPEDALQIILLCARVLQRIAQTQIEREVRTRFPIVLHEGCQAVPAVVVIN